MVVEVEVWVPVAKVAEVWVPVLAVAEAEVWVPVAAEEVVVALPSVTPQRPAPSGMAG